MARRLIVVTALVTLLAAFLSQAGGSATAPPAGASTTGLATGIVDPWEFGGTRAQQAFDNVRKTGASYVRIYLIWRSVSPAPMLPADAENPTDPRYQWATVDAEVINAVQHGLVPILDILDAPDWAKGPLPGSNDPAPRIQPLAVFAKAAARRYSGGYAGLPRVRYWQVWNEPNLDLYLKPQRIDGNPVSPAIYRNLLVYFADAVKSVDPGNMVIAGALTPFKQMTGVAPLEFTRELFCLGPDLKPTCNATVPVDIWAIHPYSWGGPTWKAQSADDESLGDLPALRKILDAAIQANHLASHGKLGLWATEFSWASDPPTKGAVPMGVLTRWIPEALHQMWLNGVSNVIWFSLYDRPPGEFYHSGLYFIPAANGTAKQKPAAAAFRFPFVAYPKKSSISVWGRTPTGKAATVTISVRKPSGWKVVGSLRANAYGIFSGEIKKVTGWSSARAQVGAGSSAGFAAKAPPVPKFTKLF